MHTSYYHSNRVRGYVHTDGRGIERMRDGGWTAGIGLVHRRRAPVAKPYLSRPPIRLTPQTTQPFLSTYKKYLQPLFRNPRDGPFSQRTRQPLGRAGRAGYAGRSSSRWLSGP